MEQTFHGIPVAPGIVWGEALVYKPDKINVPRFKVKDPEEELNRVQSAIDTTRIELQKLYDESLKNFGSTHARIFEAHLALLDDEFIHQTLVERIQTERLNAEAVLQDIIRDFTKDLSKTANSFFKEREADVIDVVDLIIRNLQMQKRPDLLHLKKPCILISTDLAPSEAAKLNPENIRAIVLERGSPTAHVAILAKALKIPTVVGIVGLFEKCHFPIKGTAVDATNGTVFINPSAETLKKLKLKKSQLSKKYHFYEKQIITHSSTTADGKKISVYANIEFLEEIDDVIKHISAGIGLYRTEYKFLNKPEIPTEDEQYHDYFRVAKLMKPRPVIIRTIDIGGDKLSSLTKILDEQNPQLGCRGIRLCLSFRDFFKTQLRAILRASELGNIKIMFPMISSVEEIREVKKIMAEVMEELEDKKIPFNKNIEIGVMIEVPSAVMIADALAKECNFFSIGTNDLIQYSLAVDRNNEHVANLYQPAHPAILKMIKTIIDSAKRNNIDCSICGEMASDPLFTELLIGLGLESFSMSSLGIPQIRALITTIDAKNAEEFAQEVLQYNTVPEIERVLLQRIKTKYKHVIQIN